jgi:hypothetical protein
MNNSSLARNLWVWFVAAVLVTLVTLMISNAVDTPGDNNDSGLAEVMNTIGFFSMLAVLPLLVAAIVQTIARRKRAVAQPTR